MLDERFVILGVLISFSGGLSYLWATIKGRIKPNRVTWLFWTVVPLIAFAAELDEGVGIQSLMTFIVGFNPLLIFLASFINKEAYWKLDKTDYFYGFLATIGLVAWLITGEGNVAIFFAILADGLASIPTLIKAYEDPDSEDSIFWPLAMTNSGITILTISIWNFAHWGFPIYIFSINTIIFALTKFKLGEKPAMHKIFGKPKAVPNPT